MKRYKIILLNNLMNFEEKMDNKDNKNKFSNKE